MPKFFHVDLPEALSNEMLKCKNDEQITQVGAEWAITQCKELVTAGVPSIHFYTMGKSAQTVKIAEAVY